MLRRVLSRAFTKAHQVCNAPIWQRRPITAMVLGGSCVVAGVATAGLAAKMFIPKAANKVCDVLTKRDEILEKSAKNYKYEELQPSLVFGSPDLEPSMNFAKPFHLQYMMNSQKRPYVRTPYGSVTLDKRLELAIALACLGAGVGSIASTSWILRAAYLSAKNSELCWASWETFGGIVSFSAGSALSVIAIRDIDYLLYGMNLSVAHTSKESA